MANNHSYQKYLLRHLLLVDLLNKTKKNCYNFPTVQAVSALLVSGTWTVAELPYIRRMTPLYTSNPYVRCFMTRAANHYGG